MNKKKTKAKENFLTFLASLFFANDKFFVSFRGFIFYKLMRFSSSADRWDVFYCLITFLGDAPRSANGASALLHCFCE